MLNGMMNIIGDISYSDKYYYNLRNYSADKFDSYTMVNLGLGWSSEDDHWQAGFKVNNVTDERAGIQGFDIATACGCNEISFRAPRWFGFKYQIRLLVSAIPAWVNAPCRSFLRSDTSS